MSGSLRAIWDQTKTLSHKQEFSCLSYLELCVIFLKVTHSAHMQRSQPCEGGEGDVGYGSLESFIQVMRRYFFEPSSALCPLGGQDTGLT